MPRRPSDTKDGTQGLATGRPYGRVDAASRRRPNTGKSKECKNAPPPPPPPLPCRASLAPPLVYRGQEGQTQGRGDGVDMGEETGMKSTMMHRPSVASVRRTAQRSPSPSPHPTHTTAAAASLWQRSQLHRQRHRRLPGRRAAAAGHRDAGAAVSAVVMCRARRHARQELCRGVREHGAAVAL
eukprot:364088-Chlamydomonas_euryale.AAC.7